MQSLLLPDSSYARVTAFKPKTVNVIWRRPDVNEEFLLQHAYALPGRNEDLDNFEVQVSKDLYADRYGGFGVGYCAGSGRCAGDDHAQLKGVGITPLWRPNPQMPDDQWHSNGIVDAVEAAREIIWTSICSDVLPYGVVPILGAIAIGPGAGTFHPSARVVLFRENCLRPAHFMRNVLMERQMENGVHADVARVSNSLRELPDIFSRSFGLKTLRRPPAKVLSDGLVELSRRLSIQLATAFARRIFHGAPLCSNLTIDGKLLDFGATTSVSGYQREAAQPGGIDQWNQRQILMRGIAKFHDNVLDYSDFQSTRRLIGIEVLKAEIDMSWEQTVRQEMFRLAGFNRAQITEKLVRRHQEFIAACISVMSSSARVQYVIRNSADKEVSGAKDLALCKANLNAAIAKISTDADRTLKIEALRTDLGISEVVATNLVLGHESLVADVAEGRLSVRETPQMLYDRALRRNQELDFLRRHVLDEHFASMKGTWADFADEIHRVHRNALEILRTDD